MKSPHYQVMLLCLDCFNKRSLPLLRSVLLFGLTGGFFPLHKASAQTTYDWISTTGSWTVGANWYNATAETFGAAPLDNTANTIVRLVNGEAEAPAETVLNTGYIFAAGGQMEIGEHNTLTLNNGISLRTYNGIYANYGVIQTSGSATLWASQTAGNAVNAGVIRANAGGQLIIQNQSITNAGGMILATTSGTIRISSSTTVSGGAVQINAGGVLRHDGMLNSSQNLTLTGVSLSNSGTYSQDQNTNSASAGSTTVQTTVGASTVFTNAVGATTEVLNTGTGNTTSTGVRASTFVINNGGTFDNKGYLILQNSAVRTGSTNGQTVSFNVASGGTFLNTGTIDVIHNSVTNATSTVLSSTNSFVNQGVVRVTGNANDTGATFQVMGGTNIYSQSGSGQLTLLSKGGALSASSISISTGTFGGVGSVSGHTTIGSNATLTVSKGLGEPLTVGTLSFANNLSLSGTTEIVLGTPGANRGAPGVSDRINVAGTVALGGALQLSSDGNAGAGSYRVMNHAGVSGSFASVNAIGSGTSALHAVVDASEVGSLYVDLYAIAGANTLSNTVDLGIIHKNESFGTSSLAISNVGTGGAYTETLKVNVKGTTGNARGTGNIAALATTSGTSTAISVGLGGSTASVGAVSGTVTLEYESNGVGGFSNTALPDQIVTVTGQVNDYGTPVLSSTGNLSATGPESYKLDLGNAVAGSGVVTVDLSLANELLGGNAAFQDFLSGEVSGFSLFTLQSGESSFLEIKAGEDIGWVIAFDTDAHGEGIFTETITFTLTSDNPSEISNLPGLTLDLELTVIPEPHFWGLLAAGSFALVRFRRPRR